MVILASCRIQTWRILGSKNPLEDEKPPVLSGGFFVRAHDHAPLRDQG